jgi:hypothetical protein
MVDPIDRGPVAENISFYWCAGYVKFSRLKKEAQTAFETLWFNYKCIMDKVQRKRDFSKSVIKFKTLKHEIQPIIHKLYSILQGRQFSPLRKSTVEVLSGYIL